MPSYLVRDADNLPDLLTLCRRGAAIRFDGKTIEIKEASRLLRDLLQCLSAACYFQSESLLQAAMQSQPPLKSKERSC